MEGVTTGSSLSSKVKSLISRYHRFSFTDQRSEKAGPPWPVSTRTAAEKPLHLGPGQWLLSHVCEVFSFLPMARPDFTIKEPGREAELGAEFLF